MENVITLSKLIGLLLLFCHPTSLFCFENSKNTRNELARPVMGTIFLVILCDWFWEKGKGTFSHIFITEGLLPGSAHSFCRQNKALWSYGHERSLIFVYEKSKKVRENVY